MFFLFDENWIISVTMVLWSFIAWSTAEWGWAIAFPVFTKLFNIAASDAKVFSLMIQSIGMSMAMFIIWLKKIKVLKNVIIWWALWWFLWQLIGVSIVLSSLQLKILFTVLVSFLWIVLLLKILKKDSLNNTEISTNLKTVISFIFIWTLWWLLTSKMWTWLDMVIFILLTMLYWINAKISTPTTICLMATNSIFWFILQLYLGWVNNEVLTYWLVSIPVVVIWAPLWAIIVSKISQNILILFLLSFILLDIFSTIYTIKYTNEVLLFSLQSLLVAFTFFYLMHFVKTNYILKKAH